VSPGRWHQLESGWQKNKGVLIPIGTTAATIAAAARAVEWDAGEALRTAGFTSDDVPRPIPTAGLDRFSDDELLAEVRKRMRSAAHAAPSSSPAAPPAPGLRVVDRDEETPALKAIARTQEDKHGQYLDDTHTREGEAAEPVDPNIGEEPQGEPELPGDDESRDDNGSTH
jgi:hypothetical protein